MTTTLDNECECWDNVFFCLLYFVHYYLALHVGTPWKKNRVWAVWVILDTVYYLNSHQPLQWVHCQLLCYSKVIYTTTPPWTHDIVKAMQICRPSRTPMRLHDHGGFYTHTTPSHRTVSVSSLVPIWFCLRHTHLGNEKRYRKSIY